MTRNRRLDPEWRQFEQLVSRVERDADKLGVTIQSPDRLRCKVTGRLREVDASIRTPRGELITLECRMRRSREDITWIEQLATKRRSLGAVKTIAVSAAGFSEGARLLAKENAIELKQLRELSPDQLNPLLSLDFVLFWHPRIALRSIGLIYARGGKSKLPDPSKPDRLLPENIDLLAPLFRNVDEGHRWSVNDVGRQLQEAANPFPYLAKGEPPLVRSAWFPYPNNVTVDLPDGTLLLGGVILTVALWWEAEQI